jgi:hypothetical protein
MKQRIALFVHVNKVRYNYISFSNYGLFKDAGLGFLAYAGAWDYPKTSCLVMHRMHNKSPWLHSFSGAAGIQKSGLSGTAGNPP